MAPFSGPLHLDLTVQALAPPTPSPDMLKLVHNEARTVRKQTVAIRLKCLLFDDTLVQPLATRSAWDRMLVISANE